MHIQMRFRIKLLNTFVYVDSNLLLLQPASLKTLRWQTEIWYRTKAAGVCNFREFWCLILWMVESGVNVTAHGDLREGKWRGNWWTEWVASALHSTPEHGASSITTADAHTSAASSRLNWSPRRFKWTRPFRRKTKSGFCACATIFQTQSTVLSLRT
jgi:hypothetical protein